MSLFQTDHELDLKDPKYRDAFLQESRRIATIDATINALADRVLARAQEGAPDDPGLAERRAQALRDIDLLYTAAANTPYDYDSIPYMSDYEFDALVRITGRPEDEILAAVNLCSTEGAPTLWEILDLSGPQFMEVLNAWMLGIGAVVVTPPQ
jgi:hypothetical protein